MAGDPFAPETYDPFYVPPRGADVLFIGLGVLMLLMWVGSFLLVPLQAVNLVVVAGFGACSLFVLRRGVKDRNHRLHRQREVAELREKLLGHNNRASVD